MKLEGPFKTGEVSLGLESLGDKTRLTITESGFAGLPDSRREKVFRGNS